MTTTPTHPIDPTTELGQLVGNHPEFATVFESLGIDYCCGGETSLQRACAQNDLELETVLEQLDTTERAADAVPADASITELIDDIVNTHHDFLRAELPSLERLVRKVTRVHGESQPELEAIESTFLDLKEEVTHHIADEEENAFPVLRALETAGTGAATDPDAAETDLTQTGMEDEQIRDAIAHLEAEHDTAAEQLERLRSLSDNYAVPEDACTSYRNILDRLQLLEADMHQHVHKENNVLFPKAEQALEAGGES
ncbi:iron-sulfur cluster repair di-iron protein [Natrialba hulunbeirensis JCM 10989]|uniref:Iron-sulfur cluster repair di-iron protein n=1 Tax=Natrialba hulunbeirensis JCM 10989 TaxID=1227493 RepID=M0A3F1_9EURY|nr:iron-sulfur cluster repair di-iron protein [Natrialba hulunbeirensis]ELY92397.1 iron-sulfur cluster repair di-iron protein [Natrialba hulunbeirensis JCM 10989]